MSKKSPPCDIPALLRSYLSTGSPSAYDELVTCIYRDIQKHIFYTLRRFDTVTLDEYLRDEAADLCHDFFMDKFDDVIRKYNPDKGSFRTWVFRCVSNYVIDSLRKRSMGGKEEPLQVDEEEWKSYYVLKEIAEDALHNPHHEREQSELLEVILRYVEGLPEHYRRTVRLKLEGLTDDEVAKELKLPVGTIKSHYSRAKQILRDRLKGDGYL